MGEEAYAKLHCVVKLPKIILASPISIHRPLEIGQSADSSGTDEMKEEGCRFADYLFEYGASGFLEAMRGWLDKRYVELGALGTSD